MNARQYGKTDVPDVNPPRMAKSLTPLHGLPRSKPFAKIVSLSTLQSCAICTYAMIQLRSAYFRVALDLASVPRLIVTYFSYRIIITND